MAKLKPRSEPRHGTPSATKNSRSLPFEQADQPGVIDHVTTWEDYERNLLSEINSGITHRNTDDSSYYDGGYDE